MSKFWRFCRVGVPGALLAGASTGGAEIRETGVWWLPRNVSHFGHEIDFMIYVILWITGITGILVFSTMIYFIVKYRHRGGVGAIHSHGNNTLEVVWTTIPVFIFLGLAIYGNEMWGRMRMQKAPADALQVAVVPVQLHLSSKDVIHAFYVPEFRLYQDMVPGRVYDFVWFKADSVGSFQLACNQLCGQGHYKMFGKLAVVSDSEYEAWAKGKAPAATASLGSSAENVATVNR
ncbi:MAG: cytochrome c oxidase subunit II [Verrucomicrobia bacterium]|nr:cytochrome c oxidase subunit II [Verrucomicrobiota bacterium]